MEGREGERDDRRRWFSDDEFDLIVWLSGDGSLAALQLCYDKSGVERAVTWSTDAGYGHFRVDTGEEMPVRDKTPILLPDGPFGKERVLTAFVAAAKDLDPPIRAAVVRRLEECPV